MDDVSVVVVLGIGDVGSAVAHRLFRSGFTVAILDSASTTTSRRGMAFADAMFDGSSTLDGVTAIRVDDAAALLSERTQNTISVFAQPLETVIDAISPGSIVDARMRKRAIPDSLLGLAPLTVGLGPGFVAGETVDLAIETSWDAPGRIIEAGPTLALAGEPRPIGGHARERYVYAPTSGTFRTERDIGAIVNQGDIIAVIGETELAAPLSGRLRGLTHDGVLVSAGTKVIEVDPRGAQAIVTGIGERPGKIADGVLRALSSGLLAAGGAEDADG